MANRYGNDYRVLIQADASFDTEPGDLTTGWTKFADKLEISDEAPEGIDLGQKDNNIVRYDTNHIAGLKKPKVELSGEFTYNHKIMFLAMGMSLSVNDYTIDNANTTNSYTIIQQFAESEANKITGCVLESFTLSRGGPAEPITYTATFRAGTLDRENTDTYEAMAVVENDVFLPQNSSAPSLGDGNITTVNSWELSLTRVFTDDKYLYQQSDVWTQALQCEIEGTFTATYQYDSSNDANVFDDLMTSAIPDVVTIKDAASGENTLAITTYGKYTDYTTPDPDRCIFEGNFTKKLAI